MGGAHNEEKRKYPGLKLVDYPKHRTPWWQSSGTTLSADGTPLAFASGGPSGGATESGPTDNGATRSGPSGGRALVCANGVGVSTFFWDYVGAYFSSMGYRVVVWDYPGHGASASPADPRAVTIASLADDMSRVMDANGIGSAVLLGHSLGCQVILEFYRLFPERVAGLIPILGAFGRPASTFIDPRVGEALYRGAYRAASLAPDFLSVFLRVVLSKPVTWQLARLTGLVHPDLARREDMEPYLEHLSRLDVRIFFEFVRAAQAHDAGPILGTFDVPALVIGGERDLFTPWRLSIEMAERMPRAELLEIPRGSHAALIEQPELINLRIEKFIRESVIPFEAAKLRRTELEPGSLNRAKLDPAKLDR